MCCSGAGCARPSASARSSWMARNTLGQRRKQNQIWFNKTPTKKQNNNIMKLDDLRESKYLKRADVGAGVLLTMKAMRHENMALEGEPPEMKYVLYFNEVDKGLALNQTNAALIMQALGVDDTDLWFGRQIVLFDDPSIMFKGRPVGGIRCRAPRGQAALKQPAPPAAVVSPTPPPAVVAAIASGKPSPAFDEAVDNCPF